MARTRAAGAWRWLRQGGAAALGVLLAGLAFAASPAGDAQRGRALYLGEQVMAVIGDDGQARPMPQAACVQCHRRSALGSFEGSLAAPPIAGPLLFKSFDRDTGGFFRDARRDRVRPAYDDGALHALLATGRAPDGHVVRAPMPRYALGAADAVDLAAYLRTFGAEPVPGLDAHTIHLATVFTPAADAASRRSIEAVMRRFVELKNAQMRQDTRRARQAERNHEMAMNRKFRHWQLEVWTLEGEPQTWAAQLERHEREQPVFALVGGMGRDDWLPVHRFCEMRRMPCLLPWLESAPIDVHGSDFYSLYFHPGRRLDLALAAAALRDEGVRRVELWSDTPTGELRPYLATHGLVPVDDGTAQAVLSLLPPSRHLERLAAGAPSHLAWAPGPHPVSAEQWRRAAAPLHRGLFVTPLKRASAAGVPSWQRAALWLHQQNLDEVPPELGAATLQALTTLGDALVHIDFDFTREYVLELLEHGLENMIGYGPYDRLAVAPGQRIGVKGSHVARVEDGRVFDWTWQLSPPDGQNREITTTDASARPLR